MGNLEKIRFVKISWQASSSQNGALFHAHQARASRRIVAGGQAF
jgi:hypothetical protein